jgi:hypothetical protein
MTIDEHLVSDALHAVEVDVAPDLAARVRRGGQRRLLRRRSVAAAGVTAVAAAGVPTAIALGSGSGSRQVQQIYPASSGGPSAGTVADLYATPPAAGAHCNSSYSARASATDYPQLLLMPVNQQVKYAFVRQEQATCLPAHVALTAYRSDSSAVTSGLEIDGPNAPTAAEDGREGASVEFSGDTGHLPVDGRDATEFTITSKASSDIYWTEPDGGQWHASVTGLSQAAAVALLNQVSYDGANGTASLPRSSNWTVAPAATDLPSKDTGWVTEQWTDPQGNEVDLDMTQTPDRTDQQAAQEGDTARFVTVGGHRAVLDLAQDFAQLTWQDRPDVQARLSVSGGTADEVEMLASNLSMTTPSDPRINSN